MARVSQVGSLVALLLGLVVLTAGAQPALAIPAPIQVAGTGGQGVQIRPTPDTSRPAVGWMPEGASPDFNCFTYGQMIGNVNVWFSVNYNGATGYYASYYDNSSYSSEAELTAKYGIPKCGAQPPPASPSVTLAQGPAAPAGYRYAITLNNFQPNSAVSISCRDSVSPNGFYTFSLTTNGSGAASTSSFCYSGDGPEHWVVAGGVTSNRVSWGGGGGATTPPAAASVALTQGPAAAAGYWYGVSLSGYTPRSSVAVTCFDSVSPGGFRTFSVTTDGSGAASNSTGCYSGDGPDHWVVAGGVQSNRVSWGNAVPLNGPAPVAAPAPAPVWPSGSAPSSFRASPQRCAGDATGSIVDKLSIGPDPTLNPKGSKITILPGPKGKVPWYADNSKIAAATSDMWNIMAPCLKKLKFTMTRAQTRSMYYQLNCHFYLQRSSSFGIGSFGSTYDMETWRTATQIPSDNLALQRFYLNIERNCNWT